jgi:DNA-binding response OmpR family regulator
MRVLLCEDDELIGTMVRLNLTLDGYDVEWTRTGEGALTAMRNSVFDLALLDIRLPGLSGIDVTRAARRDGVVMPILMMTAASDLATKIAALDQGADDYLCKPFDIAELLARMRAAIRRTEANRARQRPPTAAMASAW